MQGLNPVSEIAVAIQSYYELERRKSVPNYSARQSDFQFFLKAAELCSSLNANPAQFVHAQARRYNANQFYPQFLYSKYATQYYREYMEQSYVPPDRIFDAMVTRLKNHIKNLKRGFISALLDDELGFTAWFRIVMTKEPYKEIVDKYRQQARLELDADPSIVEFLKSKKLDYTRITK